MLRQSAEKCINRESFLALAFSVSRPAISSDYTLFSLPVWPRYYCLVLARPLLLIIGRTHPLLPLFNIHEKSPSIHGWFACNIRRKINELMREKKTLASLVPLSILLLSLP